MTPNGDNPEFQMDEVLPADEPPAEPELMEVLPLPNPPHPNFWWSLLWCFFIFVTLNGTVIASLLVIVGDDLLAEFRAKKSHVSNNGTAVEKNRPEENGEEPREDNGTKDSESARADRLARLQTKINQNLAIPVLIGEILTTLLALITLRVFVGRKWMRAIGLKRPGVTHLTLVLIALPSLLILPNMIHELAKEIGIPSLIPDPNAEAELFGNWPLWFGVLVIGVGPGLSEELWCRGFLGRGLVANYGPLLGILVTSLLFGLLHVDPPKVIATALMGLWLHFSYLMSRSLVVPMILHTLNNSLAVFEAVVGIQIQSVRNHAESASPPNRLSMQIYTWLDNLEKMATAEPYVIAAGSAILLFTVAWALFASRTRLVVAADETAAAWRPDFPGVEYPPLGSVTKIYRPWPGWLASVLVVVGILAFAGSCSFAYWKL